MEDEGKVHATGQTRHASGSPSVEQKPLRVLLEPVLFLTVALGLGYLLGYVYYSAYYEFFGIPLDALALDHARYLEVAVVPAAALVAVILWSTATIALAPVTRWIAIRESSGIGLVGGWMVVGGEFDSTAAISLGNVLFVLGVGFVVITAVCIWRRKSYLRMQDTHYDKALTAVGFVGILVLAMVSEATSAAEDTVRGRLPGRPSILISLVEAEGAAQVELDLIFLGLFSDNYFVVERQDPLLITPAVHMFPVENVAKAMLYQRREPE